MPSRLTALSMAVAGVMLAHHTASRAVREALFLSGPGIEWLPLMVMATAIVVVAAVPVFARLLARFGPRRVVPAGFLLSAAGHLIEWQLPGTSAWVAVVVYLHVAGFAALLLSGFWSLLSELFDPREARESYGPVAAAGTVGGLGGGLAVVLAPVDASLLVLAAIHAAAGAGAWSLARVGPVSTLADDAGPAPRLFEFHALRRTPHLATLALLVLVSTATAGIVDFLFKQGVTEWSGARVDLQMFFAAFYMAVGVLTFAAQAGAGRALTSLGLGRTVAALPAGLGLASAAALVVQAFPLLAIARATEAVFRGSWFRSGYELVFVPMAPDEKRRVKTFIDVTCDRGGDLAGALVVQAFLVLAIALPATAPYHGTVLLAVVIGLAAAAIPLARRLDPLYRGVVERRLAGQAGDDAIAVPSETGWTVLDLPVETRTQTPRPHLVATPIPRRDEDVKLRVLADLRSGNRTRVETAVRSLERPDRLQIVQLIQLLAWDDLVPVVRLTLERSAAAHTGLLGDVLTDPDTDFAVRRRLPRILGLVPSARALDSLLTGLEDPRFEVRYQCARAIPRVLAANPELSVDPQRILALAERELSVPLQIWQGHRLLDRDETDDDGWRPAEGEGAGRNIEHLFLLLSLVLPREPLQAAFRGIASGDPSMRSLTLEYLEGALPAPIVVRLWALIDFGV
jgi:ATP:ADP antiporter, AAA family